MAGMDTRDTLLAAALKVLEEEGEAQFSTRAICAIANVTAPTLYHHFSNADGLLSAAIAEAFRQFLESKKAAVNSPDPETALRQGWDDYVRFAAARPRLYAAMMTRVLKGGTLPAAEQGAALLTRRIQAIAAEGRLVQSVEAAADLVWASANAAALLFVTAQLRNATRPDPVVIDELRERTMQALLTPRKKAKAK
jgi:AcrR family transcriptional regulator